MSDKEKELNEEVVEDTNNAEEVKEEANDEAVAEPAEETAEVATEETQVEEAKEETVEEESEAEEIKAEESKAETEADKEESEDDAEEEEAPKHQKSDVEKKIQKKIKDKEEKDYKLGINRIAEYIKTEHKWENFLFLGLSAIVMVLGGLILNGALVVRDNIPVIGEHPDIFGWVLLGMGFLFLLYSLYPFFKPAFPELKKITWLSGKKFVADLIRVFLFIIILVALFILYDVLITGVLRLIF